MKKEIFFQIIAILCVSSLQEEEDSSKEDNSSKEDDSSTRETKQVKWHNPCSFKIDGKSGLCLNIIVVNSSFSVDPKVYGAFQDLFGDYFGKYPCSELQVCLLSSLWS